MKKVYFVRHGKTGGNESNSYQTFDTPLSEKGREQANFLAERFTKIRFDILISSSMNRALETAGAIAQKTKHSIVSEDLFCECLRPTVVRGKSKDDEEVKEIAKILDSYWKSEDKRHSDEENFFDLKSRAIKALEYLKNREEEIMVVVTHGAFLKMLLSVMIRGEKLDPEFYDEIEEFFFPENTGITVVEYDNKYHPNKWQLMTWSDQAHLG
jgi:probable phosphoglycerate mutase